jgi:hypothetical protein
MNHMQRSLPVSVAILLAACGVAATTSNDAAESATQSSGKAKQRQRVGFESFDRGGMAGCFDPNLSGYARQAAERIGGVPCAEAPATSATGSDPWIGEYEGPAAEGMTGHVSIAAGTAPNRYRLGIDVTGPGCSGSINGTGIATNNRMSLTERAPGQAEQCRISLVRNGSTIVVGEIEGCLYFHGAQCSFDARVTRQSSASARPTARPAPSAARPWIVGAWVSRGVSCGGEGVLYGADGTYTNGAQSGRWQLSGNTLTETALQAIEMGESETPIRNPRPIRSQILSVAPNRNAFTMRTADGQVWQMVRCR